MRNLSREQGFTITEMMVATAVVLVVLSGALTTFKNALAINDSASQLADANQNLRAGTNQLIRDLLMAGRIIGTEGIAMPTGPGITYARPGPAGVGNFDMIADTDATLQMPSDFDRLPARAEDPEQLHRVFHDRHDHHHDGRRVHARGVHAAGRAGNAHRQRSDALARRHLRHVRRRRRSGSTATPSPTRRSIKVGDLVLYVGTNGNAIQTVTSIDKTLHRI